MLPEPPIVAGAAPSDYNSRTGAGAGAAKKMHAAPHHWQTKAGSASREFLPLFFHASNQSDKRGRLFFNH